jgi:hypothetical protein
MRHALILTTLLATASQPSGCGSPTADPLGVIPAPWEAACQGLACGDGCAFCPPGTDPGACPVPTLVATACSARGQCLAVGTFLCGGETCAGRACGTACDGACPFGAPCPAPVVCDGAGQCTAWRAGLCVSPCAGLPCGATCHTCPPEALDCLETTVVKACGGDGVCRPVTPAWSCS